MECFIGGPCGCLVWCSRLLIVPDWPMIGCTVSTARSDNIVLGTPSSSIMTDSLVVERMQYVVRWRHSNSEYDSVASKSTVATTNGG